MTHRIVAVFIDELVYCNIIGMKLRTSVIPTDYVLTGWRGEKWKERERERDNIDVHCIRQTCYPHLQLTFLNMAAMFSR